SNDADVTMFTIDQNAIMNTTLDGSYDEVSGNSGIGYREYMWSNENIEATGTSDGYIILDDTCSSKFDFVEQYNDRNVCLGTENWFRSIIALDITSAIWNFGDGNIEPSDYVAQFGYYKKHTYANTGQYDVKFTIQYNELREARASSLADLDITNASSYDSIVENLIVQGTQAELIALGATNIIEITLDSLGLYWGINDSSYFRGYLEKVTYVAYYQNTCTSAVTKVGFVTVNTPTASSNASSYSYSFENASELNGDWVLSQSTNIESQWNFNAGSNTAWKWESGTAADGSSSIKVDGDEMLFGVSTEIISKAYDLSAFTTPAIKFSWSGASLNTFPVNTLVVTYSDNCGESWKSLGTIGAIEASNAGLYTTKFKPNSSEWKDTVMTKTQLKDSNIRFKFEYVVNGSSNNFYLDHIQIGEQASLMIAENTTSSKLSVFPNPAKGNATIVLDNVADKNVAVTLVNILGAEVSKLFSATVVSNYQEISADLTGLEKGIYFVKVVSNGDVIMTDKLIVE
ncbi:MAG: T9SS type A sorting domain-containing protein, partial [Bacteroidetes bacterium]|nr:T9SS type A sorting domain-containing protein [Bacteroidota bacterium]